MLACLSLRRTLLLNTCQYTVYVSAKCTNFLSLASNAALFKSPTCAGKYPTCEGSEDAALIRRFDHPDTSVESERSAPTPHGGI